MSPAIVAQARPRVPGRDRSRGSVLAGPFARARLPYETASMALIKPLAMLTPDDLAMFALWESTGDADDDPAENVRPVDCDVVPIEVDDVRYHVACDVELGNGRRLSGHIGVRNGELEADSPTVVDDAGNAFGLEQSPPHAQLAAFAALFAAPFLDVFPIRWQLRLPLAGEAAYRGGELALDAGVGSRLN
jgi:hypothetical protein